MSRVIFHHPTLPGRCGCVQLNAVITESDRATGEYSGNYKQNFCWGKKTWYFLITLHYPSLPPVCDVRVSASASEKQVSHYGRDRWLKHPWLRMIYSSSSLLTLDMTGDVSVFCWRAQKAQNYPTMSSLKNLHDCDTFYLLFIRVSKSSRFTLAHSHSPTFGWHPKRSLTFSKSFSTFFAFEFIHEWNLSLPSGAEICEMAGSSERTRRTPAKRSRWTRLRDRRKQAGASIPMTLN